MAVENAILSYKLELGTHPQGGMFQACGSEFKRVSLDRRDMKRSDFLCRNYILNHIDNTLYDIYFAYSTVKKVWDLSRRNTKRRMLGPKSL